MALFPRLQTDFYNENDRGLLSRVEDFYSMAISTNQLNWSQADLDYRFYAGDQTVWNQAFGNLYSPSQRQFNFNLIRRIVQMPVGYQRRNRKSTIVIPVENSDQDTADQFTKLLMHINRRENLGNLISEGFSDALITGMSLIHMYMDFRTDPVNGEIKFSVKPYNSYVIDPFFRNQDLSDCNGILMRTYITKKQAMSLLPNQKEAINDTFTAAMGRDGKFQYMPESYNFDFNNLLAYDEFYYRTFRSQKIIANTQTGATIEWRGNEDQLQQYISYFPQVEVIEQDIPTVNLGIILDGRVMYDGPNPMGIDNYPITPILGYYTPELPYSEWRVQGIVRALRDPQFLYNRRKIIELDILESQSNSGWIAKENSFVDPKSPYKTGQGQVLWLKEEANMTDVQPIQPSTISAGMFQVSEKMGDLLQQISGINEELLGSATDDKAGILAQLRQGAGLTTLQSLFDQLDVSQKILGKLQIEAIQANWTPGKVGQIINQPPSEQFYNKNFGKYDAAVEEGFDTTTQRQLQFAQLMYLKEAGVPIPSETILQAATIQNKNELIETIRGIEQQQQQLQQAQAQSALQEQQATMQLAQARAAADLGLGLERESRIQENQQLAVERNSEVQKNETISLLNLAKALNEFNKQEQPSETKDQTEALLNLIKALKQLEGMDIDNLSKQLKNQEVMSKLRSQQRNVLNQF